MKTIIMLLTILFPAILFAQRPSGIPSDTGTISLNSLNDIILYIVIPIVLLILYYIWKRKKKNDESSEN